MPEPTTGPLDATDVQIAYEQITELVNYIAHDLLHRQVATEPTGSGPMWRAHLQPAAKDGAVTLLRETAAWVRTLKLQAADAERAIMQALGSATLEEEPPR